MRTAGVATLLALLVGCGSDAQSPALQALLPDRAAPGAQVDIVGDRLVGNSEAHFGGTAAEILLREARRLRVIVPRVAPGLQLVVVTVDGRVSNALSFTVEGALDAGP